MSLIINIYYTGKNGSARKFVNEMISNGVVDKIRKEEENIGYEYFFPIDDPDTVLLIDKWKNETALDIHHKSPMMKDIAELREKYQLKMRVEKYREYSNFEDVK